MKMVWSSFDELSTGALYAVLQLRAEVFVHEQHCAFVDPDGLDECAWHLLLWDEGNLAGCARVFSPSAVIVDAPASASLALGAASIGRIATASRYRGRGLGRKITAEALRWVAEQYPNVPVQIGAQARLRAFYESFGFTVSGAAYLEDGIAHLPMQKEVSKALGA